ncbi:hypothetical protein K2X33_01220 [bacterium]|nr:hypothetical protein [bacterium]
MRAFILAILLCLLSPSIARADYAWIPDKYTLQIRGGMDYLATGSNFANDWVAEPMTYLGQNSTLRDFTFWVKPEFGLEEGWVAGFYMPVTTAQVTRTSTEAFQAGGTGLGDMRLFLKWRASELPLFVLETELKFPTGSTAVTTNADLAVGEGNMDIHLKGHFGYQVNQFYFSATPGLQVRTGGYSSAATLDLVMQAFIKRLYIKLSVNSRLSFSAQALPGGNLNGQNVSGSGGSYARLAGSPSGISGGGALGLVLTKQFRMEAGVQRAIAGARYPEFTSFTLNLLSTFDLASPDYRPKVREVPFENETLEY